MPEAHRTCLGELPRDWDVRRIEELGEVVGGSTPSRTAAHLWGGEINWVTPGELTSLGIKHLASTREKITEAGLANCGGQLLPAGTLLVTSRATLGAVAIASEVTVTNQGFKSIVFSSGCLPDFYYHLFHRLGPELARRASGTTFLEVPAREFKRIALPVPPLPEQRKIAEVLDTVDEAIRKTEEIIAKLKQVKQGLLHDLLTRGIDENGELRDPDRHPEQFKDSPLGRIPKPWTVGSLADVGTWTSGGTPSKRAAAFWTGSIPWVSPKDMKVFRLSDTRDHVSEEGVAAGSRLVPPGSVLIVVRGMILAHTFPVCLAGRPVAFNQDVKGIVPRDGLLGEYLAYWFVANADLMLSIVTEATHGTKRIDLADLHRQLFTAPPTREQDEILEVMRAQEARLEHERREVSKLRLMKQGLLEDLLTGRVRVTALLKEAAE